MNTTYSSKATAVRGARRAGLSDNEFRVYEVDGRWAVEKIEADKPSSERNVSTEGQGDAQPSSETNPGAVSDALDKIEGQEDASTEGQAADAGEPAPAKKPRGRNYPGFKRPDGSVVGQETEGEKAIDEAISSQDFAGIGESFKGLKMPSYKVLAQDSASKSSVDKPVDFVHQFLSDNLGLSRKEAVAALVKYGVNYSTARTQYQRWFAKKGK